MTPYETYKKEMKERHGWDPFDKEVLEEILNDIHGALLNVWMEQIVYNNKVDLDFETFQKGYNGLCSARKEQPLYHDEIDQLIEDLKEVKPNSDYDTIVEADNYAYRFLQNVTGLNKSDGITIKVVDMKVTD